MYVKSNLRFLILATVIMLASTVPALAADANAPVKVPFTWKYRNSTMRETIPVGHYSLSAERFAICGDGEDLKCSTKDGNWMPQDGQPLVKTDPPDKVAVEHAEAEAWASVKAGKPKAVGGGNYALTGEIAYATAARTRSCPIAASYAKGIASAVAWLTLGSVDSCDARGGSVTVGKGQKGDVTNWVEGSKKTNWNVKDPISLELYEIETGLLFSEELFSLEISGQSLDGQGPADMVWDETGITLSSTIDGQVLVNGRSDSDWLVDPIGQFGAEIINGEFVATGAWAGLDWQLTYDESMVTAFLSAESFNPAFELDYQIPDSLLHEEYTYDVTLLLDGSSYSESESIPEPTTLVLLGLGGLALLRKRRT